MVMGECVYVSCGKQRLDSGSDRLRAALRGKARERVYSAGDSMRSGMKGSADCF